MRDLKEQGYGPRLIGAIEKGKRLPRQPAVTVETYAWFIKHASRHQPRRLRRRHLRRGAHGARRAHRGDDPALQPPDLHRHDGDRSAAAEARRRRVPGRGRRLPARRRGAPRRRRPAARAARQARRQSPQRARSSAATTTRRRSPRRSTTKRSTWRRRCCTAIASTTAPGSSTRPASITPSASRRRCARPGLRARSVSGRTPPRALAATLAAYERGDINVLVNAQLLAEGWNAPRATICMHLAPTASRRVYQQRIGRVMRLHRRKEAGVVVDFVDPAAPHSERTVTLHSLLDVDLYKPGALVTPKPPRRRQRWRRQARPVLRDGEWLIPVTDDPAATASSTRPRPARPSRPPASSRPAAPSACSS